jgi:hypothetical protein
MRAACSRGPASATDTPQSSNASATNSRHNEVWLLKIANVGAKCVLLIIAIVPLVDGGGANSGRTKTQKKSARNVGNHRRLISATVAEKPTLACKLHAVIEHRVRSRTLQNWCS